MKKNANSTKKINKCIIVRIKCINNNAKLITLYNYTLTSERTKKELGMSSCEEDM